ncbi:hypothetical protein HYY75_10150 [bacterium]|nr:hypothetical protein [bacterium]
MGAELWQQWLFDSCVDHWNQQDFAATILEQLQPLGVIQMLSQRNSIPIVDRQNVNFLKIIINSQCLCHLKTS